jgi:hypothetical protein
VPEPRHSYLRRLIMPAFSNEAIERMAPRMTAVLGRYLDAWAGAAALGGGLWAGRGGRAAGPRKGLLRLLGTVQCLRLYAAAKTP